MHPNRRPHSVDSRSQNNKSLLAKRRRTMGHAIEAMEARVLLSAMTFTVTDNSDSGATSLRAAITASNANDPGAGMANTINFAIAGAGVQKINLLSALPTITEPVFIDGYSEINGTMQATANTFANADNAVLLIQLNGANAGTAVNGLTLGAGSGGSTIRGLDITNFQADASFNGGIGILDQSDGNTITGNFVGVDATGTAEMPNGTDGIRVVDASNNTIGSSNPADRNIVSGNTLDGIHIEGTLTTPATGNLVQGNFVGVAADGTSSVGVRTAPVPNAGALGSPAGNFLFGIEVSGGNTSTIGGPVAGDRNVVGFNGAGIEVDNGGQDNVIQGNFSGVGADGVTPVANLLHGIVLRSSNGFAVPLGPAQPNEPGVSFNLVGGTAAGDGNLVEFNGTAGVAVFGNPVSASGQSNVGNAIEGNSFFENGRSYLTASSAPTPLLGIDLTNGFTFPRDDGPTPNDSKGHGAANDPNNFQNSPVLSKVTESAGMTSVTGSISQSVSPNTTFRIELFANNPDPLGLPAEGQQFIGFTNVTTDANGNASFNVSVPVPVANGRLITATATDPTGNTSEFSAGLVLNTAVVATAGPNISALEGDSSGLVLLASFTDPAGAGPLTNYDATVNWGDGSTDNTTDASPHIFIIAAADSQFLVVGTHTYAEESAGSGYTITTTVHNHSGQIVNPVDTTVSTQKAVIADQQITNVLIANVPATGVEGASIGAITPIASFTDPAGVGNETTADFAATIHWGDHTTSTGTIVSTGGGDYTVDAPAHAYAEEGTYHVNVTISHDLLPAITTSNETIVVADPAVVATGAGPFTAFPKVSTGTLALATFTDPGGAEPTADYSATIKWGDGASATGVITYNSATSKFTVSASHTYAAAGTYHPTVVVHHDVAPASNTVTDTVNVIAATISSPKGVAVSGREGRVFTGSVATFASSSSTAASNFSATIAWGDGVTSTGTIVSDGSGHFHVTGSHAYREEQKYTVKVTLHSVTGSSATTSSVATITPSPLDEVAAVANFSVAVNKTFTSHELGTFRDQNAYEDPGDYVGKISWGDGTTSSASFKFTGSTTNVGSYWQILGTHKYTAKKTYKVTVTFYDGANVGTFPSSVLTLMITAV
ncbi:MAG TPA: hypothetical protein VFE47_25605 [Tepidisphaeraceae bacterium]|nr:hypothetical protein [Tepidisphaeraceae bacterium]